MAKIIKFKSKEDKEKESLEFKKKLESMSDDELDELVDQFIGDDEEYRKSLELINSLNGEALLRRMLINSGIDIEETEFERKQSDREVQKLQRALSNFPLNIP